MEQTESQRALLAFTSVFAAGVLAGWAVFGLGAKVSLIVTGMLLLLFLILGGAWAQQEYLRRRDAIDMGSLREDIKEKMDSGEW